MRFNILFIIITVSLNATTLKNLQDIAVENREILQRYKQSIEIARQDVIIAKSRSLPRVDVAYIANSLNSDTPFGESRENSMIKGSISYNIFSGFRDKYSVLSAKYMVDSRELKTQSIEQEIKMSVALHFTDIFSKKMGVEVSQKNYEAFTQLYLESQKKFEVDILDRSKLLSVKVEQDNALINLQKAKADLQMSINSLNLATGYSVVLNELDFGLFATMPQIVQVEKNMNTMLTKRGDIGALKKIIGALGAKSGAVDSLYYPTVDIVGSYTLYDDSLFIGAGNRPQDDETRVQFLLSYNLYDGGTRDAKRAKSRADELSLSLELIEFENSLKKELKNLYLGYEVSKSNIEATKTGKELAKENLRVAKLSEKEGLITTAELLKAITNLARAQMSNIDAKNALFKNYFGIVRLVEGF